MIEVTLRILNKETNLLDIYSKDFYEVFDLHRIQMDLVLHAEELRLLALKALEATCPNIFENSENHPSDYEVEMARYYGHYGHKHEQKVFIFQGIPASGKSSLSERMCNEYGYKRINKDLLRDMIDAGKWSKKNEKQIISSRNALLKNFLNNGHSVIVDDTNYHIPHIKKIIEVAGNVADVFVVEIHQPYESLVFYDSLREKMVGKKVIDKFVGQRNSFLRKIEDYQFPVRDDRVATYTPDKRPAIIVDLDGTLAHMHNRSPYEFHKVGDDKLDHAIAGIVEAYSKILGLEVIILSGRDDSCYIETCNWLNDYEVPFDQLLLRKTEDNRPDYIVKREMYFEHIDQDYNVLFVLDDRNSVVDEWRSIGLKCLQVEHGDF